MKDLLQELLSKVSTEKLNIEVVKSLQVLLENLLKKDDVNIEVALKLTPLVQSLDRLAIKLSTNQSADWSEVKTILEQLINEPETTKVKTFTIEDMDLLISFIQEAQENLSTVDQIFLSLEKNHDPSLLNDAFRPIHTIKGVSSFLNLPHIQTLAHGMENALDYFRKIGACPDESCIQILLNSKDLLEQLISDLAHATTQVHSKKGRAQLTVPNRDLDSILLPLMNLRGINVSPRNSPPPKKAKPQKQEIKSLDNLISPDIVAKFQSEFIELLDRVEQIILQLESAQNRQPLFNDIFRQVHTIKGNAGFLGMAAVEQQSERMEQILQDLLNNRRPSQGEEPINLLLKELDHLRQIGQVPSTSSSNPTVNQHQEESSTEPSIGSQAPGTQNTIIKKEVRIDTEKLDKLFDLIGELIIAQSMVLDHPVVKNALDHDFNRSVEYLQKITRELQNISMNLRMIPLEGLFNKMHRLVRDLSKKTNKPIAFKISGQETEMDRNIIEQISDPLVHLIRNAVDHGIEPPQLRTQKGKNSEGLIHLSAHYSGNEIVVQLHDDGQGLQRGKILQKAKEKGLIGDNVTDLSDQEVWALIFEPGFSTANQVTEVSGRGVGMDVVKKNIEKLRGRVIIQSVENVGTTISLHIPLTLAILDGITFRAGKMLFALATSDVQEFQNFDPKFLHYGVNQTTFYHLRSQTLPFVDLKTFYGKDATFQTEHPVILVVQFRSKQLAILVDEVLGIQQIVMKSLPDRLRDVRAVGGCTVMGNGEVCLILDTQQLFEEALGK